jgi:hypothetical protein
MRVTPEMTTEGGGSLLHLADFTGMDDTGIKVTGDDRWGTVNIEVDSAIHPSKTIRMDPDDIDALCELLQEKKREALR